MNKDKLIKNLEKCVFCRLKPSKVNSIGVFAIKDIPKDINPFIQTYKKEYNIIILNDNDIKNINQDVKKMLTDFCKNGKKYDVPLNGLNSIDISFYLNHSDTPNITIYDDPECEYYSFKTSRLIKKDEELFIDYRKYKII